MERVPYFDLRVKDEALREAMLGAVDRVLQHGQFILGPEVKELEQQMAGRLGVPHVLGVASGTDALKMALRLSGVEPGDEVLMPSHSFFATATAAVQAGAIPVFVDVDPHTMLMSVDDLEKAISPRAKAVIPVHLGGFPCEMELITDLCEARGLALIEDCAQSVGASLNDQSTGSFGIGAFSLHPLKILSAAGDAGLLAVPNEELAQRAARLRNLGMRDRDHCDEVSDHSRLDTVQAAMLLAKLPYLDGWLQRRREHAAVYDRELEHLRPQRAIAGGTASYSTYVVRVADRPAVMRTLGEQGIDSKVHYPIPAHQQQAFSQYATRPLPATEALVECMLSIPIGSSLTDEGRGRVIDVLKTAEPG